MEPVYIIAEAGVNHNGSNEMAFELVDVAIQAGVNAVKFQTFRADKLVTKSAQKATYQKQSVDINESQFSMLKNLELSYEVHNELVSYCNKNSIDFLSTAFDKHSLNFLLKDVRLKRLKISSGEINNGPLLLQHGLSGCDLILSTGMSTLKEVEDALCILAFGLMNSGNENINPSRAAFQDAFSSKKGRQILKDKVSILHCTTEYPAPINEINLNAMLTMNEIFGIDVGYSDHSNGISVPIAATALGARIIEKHFTLDKKLPGPDHQSSLEPDELKLMVKSIRDIEVAMGDGIKVVMPSELKNQQVVRKSLVASRKIKKGEVFNENNIEVKRPGTGLSPMCYWDFIGKKASSNFSPDQLL